MPRQHSAQRVAVPLLAALGVIVIVIVVVRLSQPASRSPADAARPGDERRQGIFQHDGRAGLLPTQSFSIREGERYSALWTPARCVGGQSIATTDRTGKTSADRLALENERTGADGFGEADLPPLPTGTYFLTIDGLCSYTLRISRLVN